MRYYLAPMEGITTHIYRRTYHKYFRSMDKYFTPFLTPHTKRELNTREKKDILPEHNAGLYVVPQILSNQAEGFIKTALKLKEYGYREVNLNLGCPSKTVVGHGRGSGFLIYPEELEAFLDQIFEKVDLKISVKTRIGKDAPEEFTRLMEIFTKFPMEELIVHPRTQADQYRNTPHMDRFRYALERSPFPVCYNGDLFDAGKLAGFEEKFPEVERVMLGRGILINPELLSYTEVPLEQQKKQIKAFHDELVELYGAEMSGERNVLFKMKELWSYMARAFAEDEKYVKRIRKTVRLKEYEAAVDELFAACELV